LVACAVVALGLVGFLGGVAAAAGAATTTTAAASSGGTASADLGTIVIPNLGPGYIISSQGPLNPSQFASDSPDPSAAAGALSTLAKTITTYERVWQANGGLNQVQNLLVKFPSAQGAQVFLSAAQKSLESGEIVSKGPLATIPGARLVTYFAATNEDGVGEAITMRSGVYVALLSFFAAAAGNPQPITPSDAERVAQTQYTAMAAAPGGKNAAPATAPVKTGTPVTAAAPAPAAKGSSTGPAILLAVVVVLVLAAAVTTPLLLRRRRQRAEEEAASAAAGWSDPAEQLG
jgi:hypothetical protein